MAVGLSIVSLVSLRPEDQENTPEELLIAIFKNDGTLQQKKFELLHVTACDQPVSYHILHSASIN
jgi:hypothetical protein